MADQVSARLIVSKRQTANNVTHFQPVIFDVLVELSELLQLHNDGDDRQDEEQEERVNPENVLRIQMRDAGSHTQNKS